MAGLFVPDDWDEGTDGFCTMTVTVPNSLWWKATMQGAIYQLMFPEQWDAQTGDADQAAQTAATTYNTLNFTCP